MAEHLRPGRDGLGMSPEVRLVIASARESATLDSVQKSNYNFRAAIEAQGRHQDIHDARAAMGHQAKLRTMRFADDMDGFDLRFSHSCFAEGELRRLDELAKSDDFSRKRLVAPREAAMLPPSLPPAPIRMHVSAQVECGPPPLKIARAQRLAFMCAHREAFKGSGVIVEVPSRERCFAFVVQSPYLVYSKLCTPSLCILRLVSRCNVFRRDGDFWAAHRGGSARVSMTIEHGALC